MHVNGQGEGEAQWSSRMTVRRMLNLTLLSPAMVDLVLDGMEGDEKGLERLARGTGVVWGRRDDNS